VDINEFMNHLSTRTQSAETLRAYRGDLEKFEAYLKDNGLRANQATRTTIEGFLRYLSQQPTRKVGASLSPASVARRLSVISSFYDFLHVRSNGRIKNPVAYVKRPRIDNVEFRALDDQVVEKLIAEVPDPRDRAILSLFVSTGLRLSELEQLNKDTVKRKTQRLPTGEVRVLGFGEVVGKGSKRRVFLVDDKCLGLLKTYLQVRGPDNNPALFLSQRRKRMSCRAIQYALERWCSNLNISRAHIHQLRHTFATRMANAGMPSIVLKDLMGHKSFTTTQRYFRIRPERLAREYFGAMEFLGPTKS
jgi:site-specific recombinase XerD